MIGKITKGIGKIASNYKNRKNIKLPNIRKDDIAYAASTAFEKGAKATGVVAGQTARVAGKATLGTIKSLPRAAVNVASPMLKKNKDSLLGYRVNGLGLGVAFAGAAAVGAGSAGKEYLTQNMRGQVDGQTTPYAPRLPSYAFGEQSGASGDLVFALNKNRKG